MVSVLIFKAISKFADFEKKRHLWDRTEYCEGRYKSEYRNSYLSRLGFKIVDCECYFERIPT